jgi:hypothetical protein
MSHRWLRLTPLIAAILAVVLNTAGAFVLGGSSPGGNASGTQVIAYYAANQAKNQRWSLLVAATLVFFLVFAGFLHSYLRRASSGEVFASLAFGGAVLFSAGFGASASLNATLASSPSALQPAAAQALNALNNGPIYAANVGGCIFGVAAGLAIILSRTLPRWLGWLAIALGLVCVTPFAEFAYNVELLWTLVAAIILYRSDRPAPLGADTVLMADTV